MDRTHVYVIPEEEIIAQPSIYSGHIRKYGKVIFIVELETFNRVNYLLNDFRSLLKDAEGETNNEKYKGITSALNEKHNYISNKTIAGIFTTMITRLAMPLKFDIEEHDKKTHIIISNPDF